MTESPLELRVAAVLAERGITLSDFETLPGGHSGLTYRAHTLDGDIVIKAVPDGQKSIGRHDMLRQAAILGALADTDVPVPRIIAVDRTDPAVASSRMLRAAEVLPRLHAVDLSTLPGADAPLSPADELERWARTLGAVPTELVVGGEDLLNLLRADIPEPVEPVLVHGDYRLGNIISCGSEPAALIDWEIWSIGDPRVELGWFLVFADGTNFPGVGREVPGLPSTDALISAYTGPTRTLPDMAWFDALGRLKMAAIMGHNLRRHREGRHIDPDQEKLPATIDRLIGTGTALLQP